MLVILTFCLALGFLLKKFVWNPLFEGKRKVAKSIDGAKIKCGKEDCGCH